MSAVNLKCHFTGRAKKTPAGEKQSPAGVLFPLWQFQFPLWQFQVFWPDNFCQHFPDIIIIKLSKTEHSAHAMGKGLLL